MSGNFSVQNAPLVLRYLSFISRHSKDVVIGPGGLSTARIHVSLPRVCEQAVGFHSKDLLEMLSHTTSGVLGQNRMLYTYSVFNNPLNPTVSKCIETHDARYDFSLAAPACSIAVDSLSIVTGEELAVAIQDDLLILEGGTRIKSRMVHSITHKEGGVAGHYRVRGKALRIYNELEGDRRIHFYADCIVLYSMEDQVEVRVAVELIS